MSVKYLEVLLLHIFSGGLNFFFVFSDGSQLIEALNCKLCVILKKTWIISSNITKLRTDWAKFWNRQGLKIALKKYKYVVF